MTGSSSDWKSLKKNLALDLERIGAIKFGDFTLTSGKKSPYYIDLRLVFSHPSVFVKVSSLCSEMVEEEIGLDIDKIIGVPTSGLPFATLVSQELGFPMAYVRLKKKAHGRERAIEGVLEEGDEAVVIDDLSTTGGSVIEAIEVGREMKGIVDNAVVVLDREEGAKERLSELGVSLHSCITISEAVEELKQDDAISEQDYSRIKSNIQSSSE